MPSIECHSCGTRQHVDDDRIGQGVRCSQCDVWLTAADADGDRATNVRSNEPHEVDESTRARGAISASGEWRPARDLTDHQGLAIADDAEFFAPPPACIGQLLSASTTLRRQMQPMSPGARLIITIVACALGFAAGFAINSIFNVESFWQYVWLSVLPILGLLAGWRGTAFGHFCTYVGERGVARYQCKNNRETLTEASTFEFRDAAELRTSLTRHYTNGVYGHTAYDFSWTDNDGKLVFKIDGQHQSEKDTPKAGDLYHFAQAAELAWSQLLLFLAIRELETKGSYFFRLGGNNWIEIGPGWIDFNLKGQPNRYSREELATSTLNKGELIIKAADAREGWFRSSGVFRFKYQDIANGRLFLLLFDHLASPGGQS